MIAIEISSTVNVRFDFVVNTSRRTYDYYFSGRKEPSHLGFVQLDTFRFRPVLETGINRDFQFDNTIIKLVVFV